MIFRRLQESKKKKYTVLWPKIQPETRQATVEEGKQRDPEQKSGKIQELLMTYWQTLGPTSIEESCRQAGRASVNRDEALSLTPPGQATAES